MGSAFQGSLGITTLSCTSRSALLARHGGMRQSCPVGALFCPLSSACHKDIAFSAFALKNTFISTYHISQDHLWRDAHGNMRIRALSNFSSS
ncbi:hypothetical protein LX36DRAFT_73183 [Colletotrichum falcatum]|nr:hypothetical protein LX36DRAFT_73183 [Colletotrichum falcatum]